MGRMLCVAAGMALLLLAATAAAPPAGTVALSPESLQIGRAEAGLTVRCAVENPTSLPAAATLEAWIADMDGAVLARGARQLTLKPGANAIEVPLPGRIPEERLSSCMVHCRMVSEAGAVRGARLVVEALPQLETRVVATSKWHAGSPASLRVVAVDPSANGPIEGAAVKVSLAGKPVFTGATNPEGTVDARFAVPAEPVGEAELAVEVSAPGLGTDRVAQKVTVARESKILLTTDKPLYQPGQTMHLRTLSLDTGTGTPAAGRTLVFEVMDSKGNKVFKKPVETDPYGVAAADFVLASEVNLGPYIARAILGETQSEKQVTVERYVLPKFKVNVTLDKPYYLPGQTVKGEVQADYFFGKPVAGGAVKLTGSKFEIQFEDFATVDGVLDENGHWSFELPLPQYFAGTPIEQGKASVRVRAEVTDTADHLEEKIVMAPVAQSELTLAAIPESPVLSPGLANRIYVLAAYPDGTPASGVEVVCEGRGGSLSLNAPRAQTDRLGIATIEATPAPGAQQVLDVTARDRQGRSAAQQFALAVRPSEEGLILRTEKALYRVGDTLHAEAVCGRQRGTVYFDLLREGQTVMTRATDIVDGRASLDMDLDAATTGSLVLNAYVYTHDTNTVRDSRLVYVNPADALRLNIALDRETYKPGENAQLRFGVTNAHGLPTPAALGISIVDESVFALQEIHPGLEKVYFTLEQEIMKPRYEIHGYELKDLVVQPMPGLPEGPAEPVWSEDQQRAAQVLLASAPAPPEPGIRLSTFTQKREQAREAVQARMNKDLERIQKAAQAYLKSSRGDVPPDLLAELLRKKYLRANETVDPWGNPYELKAAGLNKSGGGVQLQSRGADARLGTADDVTLGFFVEGQPRRERWFAKGLGAVRGIAAEVAVPMPVMAPPAAEMVADSMATAAGGMGGGGVAPEPVRVRQYFPETLLFEPALITDAKGQAVLDVPMADSITTWRMTTMASAATGALGSQDSPIRVFQDFFVDIDLPVALTQHDRVSIPVVLYNYLDGPQEVRLKFEQEPWFTLEGPAEQAVQLAANEVKSMYFPIEVVELGPHTLTVYGYGTQMSDAIKREIRVLPDGEEKTVSFSDRLSGPVTHAVDIPADAIPGASKILVRVYPGVYSQIVDGLDSMLQMPSGCFEQTSSITYPNILIVQYLKATKQINPETQMKAEGFINAGYQRLLSYEVDGGGYSWFGDAPANQVLTAWGLKEFKDMAEVHEVDPAVIERTTKWLLGKQQPDGSWKPDEQYIHEESWGGIQKSSVLVTAYIADAVLSAGAKGGEIDRAVDYLRQHQAEADNAYTVALLANALVSWNPKDPLTNQVLEKLYGMRDADTGSWKGGVGTVTFSHGNAADVETTALATIAFLNAGKYPDAVSKALDYLIREKSAQGHWGSTQATILALKALMLSLGSRTEAVNATATVTIGGQQVSELKITPEDSDVMRLVDLGEQTQPGANTVQLNLAGEGSMLYQVVGRYYVPWAGVAPEQEPMTIDVRYDKRELAVNDTVTVNVEVRNNRPEAAKMVVVDLGIPPGFQVVTADLDAIVKDGILQKYEMTGRQIIGYFEQIGANATVGFTYHLQAKFPLRAQTPASRVYEYYNPGIAAAAKPQQMVVQ